MPALCRPRETRARHVNYSALAITATKTARVRNPSLTLPVRHAPTVGSLSRTLHTHPLPAPEADEGARIGLRAVDADG